MSPVLPKNYPVDQSLGDPERSRPVRYSVAFLGTKSDVSSLENTEMNSKRFVANRTRDANLFASADVRRMLWNSTCLLLALGLLERREVAVHSVGRYNQSAWNEPPQKVQEVLGAACANMTAPSILAAEPENGYSTHVLGMPKAYSGTIIMIL